MKEELDSIEEKNTCQRAKLPTRNEAIPCKIVFSHENDKHGHIGLYIERLNA